jgi:hypothetical protein
MESPITFIGTFRIPDARAWQQAIGEMAAFVEANVPGVQAFHAYADADVAEGTVVYVHPDADSLDQHLAAAAQLIQEGTAMVEVLGIELLGAPHPGTVERLRASGVPVTVKRAVVGFRR